MDAGNSFIGKLYSSAHRERLVGKKSGFIEGFNILPVGAASDSRARGGATPRSERLRRENRNRKARLACSDMTRSGSAADANTNANVNVTAPRGRGLDRSVREQPHRGPDDS